MSARSGYGMTGSKMIKTRHLAVLTVALSLASSVDATTIVGIWSPKSVVIAADSTGIFRRRGRPEGTVQVCKIFNVQGAAFAVAGLAKDPARDFDAEVLIAEVVWNRPPIHEAAATIEERLKKSIVLEMERIRKDDPSFFSRIIIGEDGYVTSFILATVEEGKPSAVTVSFQAKEQPNGAIEVKTSRKRCPGDCDGNVYVFLLGETGPINAYLREHGDHMKMPPAAAAEFLVQRVIEALPDKVGPPIDVLAVAPEGVSWNRKKGECDGIPSGFRAPNTNR